MNEISQEAHKLLKSEKNCLISTVTVDNKPNSATISFYTNDDIELIFGTWKWTRKYENLQSNSNVSFVIGFENGLNIQLEGVAYPIAENEADIEEYLQKKPSARKKLSDPEWTWFKVKPTWMRATDFTQEPLQKIEITF